jgi:potassium-transporting ATPase KdpC subunit
MKKNLVTSSLAVLAFTLLLGIAYPLAVTGISQVAFGAKADGDPSLIAVARQGPGYFQPRPSATDYSASATFFSNRGPNQKSAKAFYARQIAAYLEREAPFSPGLRAAGIPLDAVTTSGSGVDPLISRANAAIQARRVAAQRQLRLARVESLINAHTDGRFLGVLGEPGVNVTELNRALDREAR